MIRGLYTSAAGLLATQAQNETIANNVANVNTPGFKEERAGLQAFPEMLLDRISNSGPAGQPEAVPVGTMGTGVGLSGIRQIFRQGELKITGNSLDFALTTPGFFVVQTANGERYTRNGQFLLSPDGQLQTKDGDPVLGENGPITGLSTQVTLNPDGTLVDHGQVVDRLRVVDIADTALQREGQFLYTTNLAQPPQPVQDMHVRQGALEGSNVDTTSQMVQMIAAIKAYEANQKVIQAQDATLDKAVNEVGKVG